MSIKKRWKKFEKCTQKKLLAKTWRKYALFFTFTYVRQTCFACNFFLFIFLQLFQRIRNQHEILRFFISFWIKKKKKFGGVILALFANVFCKCVLDSILHPSQGLYSLFSEKKIKFVVP